MTWVHEEPGQTEAHEEQENPKNFLPYWSRTIKDVPEECGLLIYICSGILDESTYGQKGFIKNKKPVVIQGQIK